MAQEKAQVTTLSKHVSVYSLPGGPELTVSRPTNRVHRILVEQPEQQVRFMLQTVAAACITKLVLPAGYSDEHEEGLTQEFDPKDITPKAYERFDDLALLDQQAFMAAFEELNSPTKVMVENITKPIRDAKAKK